VSVAALLAAGVMLVPAAAARLLDAVPSPAAVTWKTALAQLRGSASQSAVSLAAIIVSFSLMVAMAIMVYSFRESFERWLGEVLPADLHVRVASSSDTAYWTPADQEAIADLDGIQRIRFQRWQEAYLAPDRPPVAVIAREVSRDPTQALPLVRGADFELPAGAVPTWVSEAVTDLYGIDVGDTLELPLAGRRFDLVVAGVWRDYGRSTGALVVDRDWYIARTGDETASHVAIWLAPGASAEDVARRIRGRFERGEDLQVLTGTAIRELSLRVFDRAFAVTYLLEAVAVVIGLIGVSFAFSSQALARRAEFGMLRHVGMLRRQVVGMLAGEGAIMSALGVLYGLTLGFVLSLVLVYVINRQSFNWSIDVALPWIQLALLAAVLVAAASVTAMLSGRAATSAQAVRAVREDW
jgi:putative ABC transport system permease protein